MFCFGNTANGELGLGGIEEEQIFSPRHLHVPDSSRIAQVSCGYDHTLFRTVEGAVLSCGSNERGQLARSDFSRRPGVISTLSSYTVVCVCCGDGFSLAVTQWGGVLSWGDNSHGQLGIDDVQVSMIDRPKQIRAFSTKHVVQVACGRAHCLALANDGDVFSWGMSEDGQLGEGVAGGDVHKPVIIRSLANLPLSRIFCGGYHSFALTKCGVVLGWGRNVFGQLGLVSSCTCQSRPVVVTSLSERQVRFISCGEHHTVVLTQGGGVYTFGSGSHGQLGHGSSSLQTVPRQVFELMGSTAVQISCGRFHTLVRTQCGKLLSFGLGGSGQLGCDQITSAKNPVCVRGPWQGVIMRISAGGHQNFLFAVHNEAPDWLLDDRLCCAQSQILELNLSRAVHIRSVAHSHEPVDNDDLLEYTERCLGSVSCLNGSFISSSAVTDTVFSDSDSVHTSVDRNNTTLSNTEQHHHQGSGLDVAACGLSLHALFQVTSGPLHELIRSRLYTAVPAALPVRVLHVESLRVYIMLLLLPDFTDICVTYAQAVCQLDQSLWKIVGAWFRLLPVDRVRKVISVYKEAVIKFLKKGCLYTQTSNGSWRIGGELQLCLRVLRRLHSVVTCTRRTGTGTGTVAALSTTTSSSSSSQTGLADEVFYISQLAELISVPTDYLAWQISTSEQEASGYFCQYSFVFDAAAKTQLLQTDACFQMQSAMQSAETLRISSLLAGLGGASGGGSQFLVLAVSRTNLVHDTIDQLARQQTAHLKKPLRVHFIGEEAEDAGGVKKEFFLILMRELLHPKYGMFVEHSETRTIWFSQDSYEDNVMYYLFGILCGLAIYNSTIVNMPFPLVLYKKLLQYSLGLQDIADLSPTLERSLRQLLEYTGDDVEDVFGLTFSVSRSVYGELRTDQLKPSGSDINVTQSNKQEYVQLYVNHVLDTAIERQYRAFHEGFYKVCGCKVLQLFTPRELMTLVRGDENYDWREFERNAEYRQGYSKNSVTIVLFWQVFHSLSEEQKRQFLLFLTGSDRVPILGMRAIKIIIEPSHGGDGFLPVAHTCFNLLDLPQYSTAEKLRYKLLQAIQCTEGFGIA